MLICSSEISQRNFYACCPKREVRDSMSVGSDRGWVRKAKRGIEYVAARTPVVKRAYWRYAPDYYRWRIGRRIDHSAPLDPIKIVWVDPDRISRFSGRRHAIEDRWQDIGTIKGGDWDQREPRGAVDPKEEYLKDMYYGETIEQTTLYKSCYQHFRNDTPWEDTEYFRQLVRGANDPSKHLIQSTQGAWDRCQRITNLYNTLQTNGYKSQLELHEKDGFGSDCVGYLDLITNEITVDIGRDGTLLFVDSRHRLCLAKILELDSIPVCILARHTLWVEYRDKIHRKRTQPDRTTHPDLTEIVHDYGA